MRRAGLKGGGGLSVIAAGQVKNRVACRLALEEELATLRGSFTVDITEENGAVVLAISPKDPNAKTPTKVPVPAGLAPGSPLCCAPETFRGTAEAFTVVGAGCALASKAARDPLALRGVDRHGLSTLARAARSAAGAERCLRITGHEA